MPYLEECERAVQGALRFAVLKYKRPVSVDEINKFGEHHAIILPTPFTYWYEFNVGDRVKGHLNRLVKKKIAVRKRVGKKYYYNLK